MQKSVIVDSKGEKRILTINSMKSNKVIQRSLPHTAHARIIKITEKEGGLH